MIYMKARVKVGFVYNGEVHKVGEEFDLQYAFTWLVERGYVEVIESEPAEVPPLDEPPKKKRNG